MSPVLKQDVPDASNQRFRDLSNRITDLSLQLKALRLTLDPSSDFDQRYERTLECLRRDVSITGLD